MATLTKRENIEKLIELVEKRNAIFRDQSLPEHKDAQLFEIIMWASIAEEMNEAIPRADVTGMVFHFHLVQARVQTRGRERKRSAAVSRHCTIEFFVCRKCPGKN